MYPYLSREDCYYTDTDSVVLGTPLPEELISSTVLGKFKLEHRVKKGYFLAPKCYSLITEEGDNVLKHKGPAKALISHEWFESQYEDPSRTKEVQVSANFRIDWHTLHITKKETLFRLGLKEGNKRKAVYHNDVWVDTEPLAVADLAGQDHRIFKFEKEEVGIYDC